ncbi:sugar phosphate isomerase/epimerase family protein [Parageobacillus thermoglucosidasius]|uniref:sugar phosphate isomerase/epimerase family protein n=1 Tax=Parageobacillus thermoglucosidasius TaxID=1426 RepID=UPI000B56CD6D|nr:sugar phosphate isomerase/epimerase family protein [Parageobacillus thermoglucosidasius]OUM89027.1 MAG: xylose isomerase [Parageobacillus thermoglucosidasius]
MKNLKHSIIVGILGRYADRFHEYQPARDFYENLKVASQIPGIEGIEVVYPQDFSDMEKAVKAIQATGLPVSAVNLNVKGEAKWRYGSFTNPNPEIRAEAVQYLKTAADLAAELGTDMVTCCPLIDGHDYNFQADYRQQWKWLVEGIREGASYRPDIKISLEYKPYEARNRIVLPDMGRTLHLCNQIGLPNVGVTMDVGHALAAQENPAEMVCLAEDAGRLFYVHFNDNDRGWDWDMLPGSVNLWDLIETLYYLDRLNWSGWVTYDVFTRHGDPAEAFAVTIRIMEKAQELLYKLGPDRLEALIAEGNTSKTFDYVFSKF